MAVDAKTLKKEGHGPVLSPFKVVSSVTFHKCCICEELVLCDITIFYTHLNKHKMKLTDYRKLKEFTGRDQATDYYLKLKVAIGDVPAVNQMGHFFETQITL